MLIHIVRGPIPLRNTLPPSSAHILLVMPKALSRCVASIIRVFNTSSGVVNPAAMAPDIEPNRALSRPVTSGGLLDCRCRRAHFFMPSHKGNWITVKGTSRITVMLHPRYSSRHTCTTPCVLLWPRICVKADSEDGCCRACALCLMTSVGTLTAHAAISPKLAASICTPASPAAPRFPDA